jgi:hypothetical protein
MFDRVLRTWFVLAGVLVAVALTAPPVKWLTSAFLRTQDLPVLFWLLGAMAAIRIVLWFGGPVIASRTGSAMTAIGEVGRGVGRGRWAVFGLAAACAVAAFAGAHWIYDGYALSLDEVMVRFDATAFAHGAPFAPVVPYWRSFESALQPQFVRPIAGGAYWASNYLPINAALYALAAKAGDPALLGPVLAVISVVTVYGVARRLWPDRPAIAPIATLLLATSSQFLITAMTPYAMSAHLAFNLVWLWLFLRGGVGSHAAALAIAFLACGIHQLAFHPLFAAPFILQLWIERRWRTAAVYTLAYAAIALFWIEYQTIAVHLFAAPRPSASGAGAGAGATDGFLAQVLGMARAFRPSALVLMDENLIRFVTWQNPLTPPLLLLSCAAALRAGGAVRSLILGLGLTTVFVLVIMPYQGHGWGYRYLHGLLGSVCLLAAWTAVRMTENLPWSKAARVLGALVATSAEAILILLPIRAAQTHLWVRPYVLADEAIARTGRDLVLVDDRASVFTADLVRNDPLLRKRPIRLELGALKPEQLRALCSAHSIALFDRTDAARFGIGTFGPPRDTPSAAARLAVIRAARCGAAGEPIRHLDGTPIR